MKKILLYIFLLFSLIPIFGQISGVVNKYFEINRVLNVNHNDVDSVFVPKNVIISEGLKSKDTVLIHQSQIADSIRFNGDIWYLKDNDCYVGKFEFLLVDTIVKDSIVIFTKPLSYRSVGMLHYTYSHRAPVQLIKVPVYKNIKVTSTLTSIPWNGRKGGIVVLIVNDTLTLNANIDVSGKGFRGAVPTATTIAPECIQNDSNVLKQGFVDSLQTHVAGLKGEGFYTRPKSMARGWAGLSNAGSGGNGYYSGGSGGGARYASGGSGGVECDLCTKKFINYRSSNIYSKTDIVKVESDVSAILGGGGGSGIQYQTAKSSRGGNGGGACIIMSDVIFGNGYSIKADGESVLDTATAGAGGGGGGGEIYLDVSSFNTFGGNLIVTAKGGIGGKTTGGAGPGGGGGGGRLHYSGPSLVASVLSFNNFLGGKSGIAIASSNEAYDGDFDSNGLSAPLANYITPLNGFVFNDMPPNQEICQGSIPATLLGTKVNSTTAVKYIWLKSENTYTWDSVGNTKNYSPPALNKTTYYKRAVKYYNPFGAHELLVDSSTYVTIKVYDIIKNNKIYLSDSTICKGSQTGPLLGSIPTGGDYSEYKFTWQYSFDTVVWKNGINPNNQNFNGLKADTSKFWIRRLVQSKACLDAAKKIKIIALDPITNNVINKTQWVQYNYQPQTIVGSTPNGGDNASYRYKWMFKGENQIFKDTTTINIAYQNYSPGKLKDTIWYKRVVYSGPANCCISYSDSIKIHVLNNIQNNKIFGNDTVCQYTEPANFSDNGLLTGGNGTYKYVWQKKTISNPTWLSMTDSLKTINPGKVTENTEYRRIAISGETDCVRDTSLTNVSVKIVNAITNNSILKDTTICYNQNVGSIVGTTPIVPKLIDSIIWQQSNNLTTWTNINTNKQISFSPGLLVNTMYYRRKVISDICKSISDTVKIIVLPLIANNVPGDVAQLCRNTQNPIINASNLTGGDNKYSYQWLTKSGSAAWVVSATDSFMKQITISDQTIYKRVVFSGLQNCCKDTSVEKTINIFELPTAVLTSFNDSICSGQSYKLNINLTGKSPWNVKFTENSSEQLLKTTVEALSVDVLPQGIVNYNISEVIDGNNCVASNIKGSGKVTVIEWPLAKAGEDFEVCGLSAQLNAEKASLGQNYWSHSPASFLPDSFRNNAVLTVSEYGKHTLLWKIKNSLCYSIDTIHITFYEQPPQTDAGEDIAKPYLFSTSLDALYANVGLAHWESTNENAIIENPNDPKTKVSNLQIGKNYFKWIVNNGVCNLISDSVLVEVKDLSIPQGFSPNNDKINDLFEIWGLENVSNAQLVVFNQWGIEVYHKKDYKNDWNGTFKGVELPEGTYLYVLNVIKRTYKGFVVIKR